MKVNTLQHNLENENKKKMDIGFIDFPMHFSLCITNKFYQIKIL